MITIESLSTLTGPTPLSMVRVVAYDDVYCKLNCSVGSSGPTTGQELFDNVTVGVGTVDAVDTRRFVIENVWYLKVTSAERYS